VSQYARSSVSSFNVRIRSFHASLVLQVGALASQGGNSTARKVGQIIARGDRRWRWRFRGANLANSTEEIQLLTQDLKGQPMRLIVPSDEIYHGNIPLLAVPMAAPMRCSIRCGFHGKS
jgi:hypothetical protein